MVKTKLIAHSKLVLHCMLTCQLNVSLQSLQSAMAAVSLRS